MNIELAFNVITTPRLKESVDFYKKHFNFEVVADTGWYKHLTHSSGVEIGFMEPNHPSQPPLFQSVWDGKGLIFSIQVKNVEAAYNRIKSENVPIAFELTTEDWGQKHFAIIDPNGIPIDIVEHIE